MQSRVVGAGASVSGLFLKTRKERRARSAGQLREGDGASAPLTGSTSKRLEVGREKCYCC